MVGIYCALSLVVLVVSLTHVRHTDAFVPRLCCTLRRRATLIGSAVVDTLPETQLSPGEYEDTKFECDQTVQFWRDFQRNGFESAEQNARALTRVASKFAAQGPDAVDFWMRHAARSGYFATNAVLGMVSYEVYDRLVNINSSRSKGNHKDDPGLASTLTQSTVSRLLLETALSYEQDYERIVAGNYKKPYDMYENTKQSSPLHVITQTVRFVQDSIGTLSRRKRKDKDITIDESPELYPEYYQTAFHYQNGGWLSEKSASVYEISTETLFLGRQDAMQRTALPPITSFASQEKRPLKVLEIACGTGRFLTFMRDNLPLDSEFTAVDLSPFYLDVARTNDENWRTMQQRKLNNNISISQARFIQGKAEDLPFRENEFDAVVCVYLFHELPRNVRSQVAKEMARVARPGGRVVFADSCQRGDRPVLDKNLANFGRMNEPYYTDYIEDNLFQHFVDAGLECGTKTMCSTTKTLSFTKPKEV